MRYFVLSLLSLFYIQTGFGQDHSAKTFARQDSIALVELYKATQGERWQAPWDLKRPIEEWKGVARDREGRVIRLELSKRGLRGTLPESFASLKGLFALDLSGNRLSGRLSPFWSLHNLISLKLSGNAFADTLSEQMADLQNLRVLELQQNQLYGALPVGLYRLVRLQNLNLSQNKLEGSLSGQIGNFRQLTSLDLSRNQFTGSLPNSLSRLGRLSYLNLSANRLDGTLPASMSSLRSLKHLNLSANQFYGGIPESWTNLRSLQYVFLSGNQLGSGIVACLNAWESLRELHAQQNRFSDRFSHWSTPLKALRVLDLSANRMPGTLSIALRNTPNLEHLNLSGNQLENKIPDYIFMMTKLRYLNLSNNELFGELPKTFSNLQSIEVLNLSHNYLEGSLEALLFTRLQQLHTLNISHNKLVKSLPKNIGQASRLQSLNLSHNQLDDGLEFLSGMKSLQTLDISHNAFEGTLPPDWATNQKLAVLHAAYNQFEAEVPEEWNALTSLRTLDVSHNKLAAIQALEPLTGLQTLRVSYNLLQDLPLFPDSLFSFRELAVEGNLLTFDDLEPSRHVAKDFRYSPQAAPATVGVCTLRPATGGQFNRYQWFQDSAAVREEGTDARFVVREAGTYYCQVSNDSLPLLKLQTQMLFTEETTPETHFPTADTAFCAPFRLTLDAGSGDTYHWNTGDSLSQLHVEEEGLYAVETVRGRCSQTDTIRIAYYGARNNQMPENQVICAGRTPEKLLAGFSDSTHTYLWEASTDLENWTEKSQMQSYQPEALFQTTYFRRWVITDSCGPQLSDTLKVQVSDLVATAQVTDAQCYGQASGSISLDIAQGLPPFELFWEDSTSTPVRQGLPAGAYTFSLKDSAGCLMTQQVEVGQAEKIEIEHELIAPSCQEGSQDGKISLQLSGGTAPYQVSWNTRAEGTVVENLAPGTYTVEVTDSLNCTQTHSIELVRETPPVADFSYAKTTFCQFENNPIPENRSDAGATFSAAPWGLVIDPNTGEIDLKRSRPGTYEVTLSFPTCTEEHVAVEISTGCLERIPNIVTPNGDGNSDSWEIPLLQGFPQATVEVYDRLGTRIFQSEQGYPKPWTARVASGIYFYRITFEDGKFKTGRVSVMR